MPSQQLIIPIILGCSLAGVSVTFLYLLYKKDKKNQELFGRKQIVTKKRNEIECRVPRQFVPAIIGRGGMTIKEIQRQTSTQIRFEDDNIECPERICIIRGSYETTVLAEAMINDIIANQPVIETYEMYIPQQACGRVIGRGGESIMEIQRNTSAKVIIDGSPMMNDSSSERRVIIKGTAEQIALALSQIEDKVREETEIRSMLNNVNSTRLPRSKLSSRNVEANEAETTSMTEATKQTAESPALEAIENHMEVYVSAMVSPSQFWIQVVGPGTTALESLVSEMTIYYNNIENQELHALKEVTIGQIVAAKFSFDERWYRAEVISISEDNHYTVCFVDYGDHEELDISCVVGLRTDFLSLRLQAVECCLANVKSTEVEWSEKASNRFAELTWLAQWKVLVAKIRGYKERTSSYGRSRREGSPIPCVDLYDKDVNVGKELVKEGLAESEEGAWSAASSTLSLSKRHDVTSPTPMSTPPSARRAPSPESTIIATPTISAPTRFDTVTGVIDLATPKYEPVEEIDLVTPVKDETNRFIANEKKSLENGDHEHVQNGNGKKWTRDDLKVNTTKGFAPGGYESDLSEDSEEFELG